MIKKFSNIQFFLFGVNFLVGYAFIMAISNAYKDIGNYFIVLILFCAFLAFTVGVVFGKLSQKIEGYGGSYLYVRKAFGNYLGFLTGWLQYIQAPLAATAAVAGIVWTFQNVSIFGSNNFFEEHQTYIIIGSFLAFFAIIIILNFGIKLSYIFMNLLWFFKWLIIFFVMILALFNLKNFSSNFINSEKINPSFKDIVNVVITFFFAYGGIEGITAISEDASSKKKINFILMMIVIFSTLFYIIYYLLIVGANGKNLNTSNTTNSINITISSVLGSGVFATVLYFFSIVSQVATKLNAKLQNGWVNAKLIAPLALDGFLPVVFAKKNKHDQFSNAIYLDSIITIIVLIFYWVAIFLNSHYKKELDATFSIYTLVVFFQYIFTFLAILKFQSKKFNLIKLSIFENIWFSFVLIILIFLSLFWLISNFIDIFSANYDFVFQLGSLFTVFIIANIIYFFSYLSKNFSKKF
ncbi:APC family permease [symbiont of Argiope bruennichi]|uniref:APC family permease n=1 Tax=symbiont of Argiope bruennichi TaxID=2810479 RepID=UPI003DA55344